MLDRSLLPRYLLIEELRLDYRKVYASRESFCSYLPELSEEMQERLLATVSKNWNYHYFLSKLSEDARRAYLREVPDDVSVEIDTAWEWLARPSQLPPDYTSNPWRAWMIRAGRGFGKTRAGAEFIVQEALRQKGMYAVVARTDTACETVNFFNEDAILGALQRRGAEFKKNERDISFRLSNGSEIRGYNSQRPDNLRGPNFSACWLDELAFHVDPKGIWDQARFATRKGRAQIIITTTPARGERALFQEIERKEGTILTRASSFENYGNLSDGLKDHIRDIEGTKSFEEEVLAELLEAAGPMFSPAWFQYLDGSPPTGVRRRVVACDPAIGADTEGDRAESGIIVCSAKRVQTEAKDWRVHGYVEADLSGRLSPEATVARACEAYYSYGCDEVIVESNQGGEWLRSAFRNHDPKVKVKLISAQVSKERRAFPVAQYYEKKQIWHTDRFQHLETQMVNFDPKNNSYRRRGSPDRLDALCWGLGEVMQISFSRAAMLQTPLFF